MQQLWPLLKQAAAAGILSGGYPYTNTFWYVGNNIPAFAGARRTDTIAQALALMQPGDVLLLGPQTYDEGNLTINTNDITIIGTGNWGECSIAPSIASANGILVKSTGVTFYGLDVAAGSAGTYAVKAGFETTASLNRFRAINCKFEGGTQSVHFHGMSDSLLQDCEIAWGTNGILFQSNSHGFCTEVRLVNCWFHDILGDLIKENANAQQVNSFLVQSCTFLRDEAGTAPSHFILLQANGNTGLITNNRFANATNQAAKITIGTGLLYAANATEAGWSTARPA